MMIMIVGAIWMTATVRGGALAERLRAPSGEISEVPEASVAYAIKGGYQRLTKIRMRKPDGSVVDVDEDLVGAALIIGYWKMTPDEIADDDRFRAEVRRMDEKARRDRLEPKPFECDGKIVNADDDHADRLISDGCRRITSIEAADILRREADKRREADERPFLEPWVTDAMIAVLVIGGAGLWWILSRGK